MNAVLNSRPSLRRPRSHRGPRRRGCARPKHRPVAARRRGLPRRTIVHRNRAVSRHPETIGSMRAASRGSHNARSRPLVSPPSHDSADNLPASDDRQRGGNPAGNDRLGTGTTPPPTPWSRDATFDRHAGQRAAVSSRTTPATESRSGRRRKERGTQDPLEAAGVFSEDGGGQRVPPPPLFLQKPGRKLRTREDVSGQSGWRQVPPYQRIRARSRTPSRIYRFREFQVRLPPPPLFLHSRTDGSADLVSKSRIAASIAAGLRCI